MRGGRRRAPRPKRKLERFCVASLPEEKSFVRVIELPTLQAGDMAHAVRWELEGVIPLPMDQAIFDFEPVPAGSGRERREVLITAFPRDIVESYHRVLARSGFTPLALELESQAISRALIAAELAERSVIIADIGANRTSFVIFAGGSMLFTKSIAVGGRDFERAIAEALGVSSEEARVLKIAVGLNRSGRGEEIFRALGPLVALLTAELGKLLGFYRDHLAAKRHDLGDVERVVLCGGDANLIGFEQYVAVAAKKSVVLGDPFANLHFPAGTIPSIPRNQSLKYTTAIGLGLRAAGY